METASKIEYRWLIGDAIDIVEPIIRARGWTPLNKGVSQVLAAFEGETLIGFCCVNLIPHVEPLFVSTPYRGTGLAEELVEEVAAMLYQAEAPAAYIVANDPASEKLAKKHGMELITSPVYYKKG